ncbi:MAG: MFS transporter [Lentimicrobiaceae bacterium]|nr:MFS transporter [Lentimicrobiaceae bacterium]
MLSIFRPQSNKILLVLCMSSFLVPFMGSSIVLALPEISKAFSFKAVTLTWMSTAYLMSSAIFQIPFARLADLVGRKKIYELGLFIFFSSTILAGFAPTGLIMLVLRVITGLGGAMIFGTNIAILTSVFSLKQRGKALAINTAVVYLSLAAGPFLGGLMTHYWGWQGIFFICGAVGLVIIVFSRLFLRTEWIESKGEKFDYIGSIIYALGLFSLIYGFTKLPQIAGFVWLLAGIVSFAIFVFYEKNHKSPVFNIRLFSGNRVFAFSSLAALINYASTAAVAFMLSLYLQYIKGFDARHAGFVLISQACIQSFFSLISGRLSNKTSPAVLATLGMGLSFVGLSGLCFIDAATPIYVIVIILLVLGMGFGIFASPNTNVVMSSVEKKYYGQASAATGTVRLTGQAFSMGIAGMAIALQVGNRPIVPAVYPAFLQSMHVTFIVFATLSVVGIYASWKRKENPNSRPQ